MQFWSGTPFLATTDALTLVRMLDEAGYYGVITALMCAPWIGAVGVDPGDVTSFRAPIERFAESVIAKVC